MPGNAGAPATTSVTCGRASCSGLMVSVPVSFTVPGCCSDAKASQCGLDTSALATMVGATFPQACQALDQAGIADASCPVSPGVPLQGTGLDIHFPGCCRPDHTCGFALDGIPGVLQIGLGCVDSTPFLGGGTPQACREAAVGGSGGSGNLAGAGGDGSDAGAGGDASALAGGASDTAGAGG